jgi:propanediol dehydratase small subunit
MTYFTALAILISLAVLLFASALWSKRYGGYMPKPFRSRSCQGKNWRRAFPESNKEEVRSLLSIFAESFAFRPSQKLQVAPDDKVLAVYCAMYPRGDGIDALELETFAIKIERKYGFSFTKVWNEELTFGQLFLAAQTQTRRRASGDA